MTKCCCEHDGPSCFSIHSSGAICTRESGHDGNHVACAGDAHHMVQWAEQPNPDFNELRAACANLVQVFAGLKLLGVVGSEEFERGYRHLAFCIENSQAWRDINRIIGQ